MVVVLLYKILNCIDLEPKSIKLGVPEYLASKYSLQLYLIAIILGYNEKTLFDNNSSLL